MSNRNEQTNENVNEQRASKSRKITTANAEAYNWTRQRSNSIEILTFYLPKILTYLLHGAQSFLRSKPVNFAASQEIPRIYGTRKSRNVPTSARHLSIS